MIRRTSGSGIAPEGGRFSSAHEETKTRISSRNILLVDDDPSILTVLAWNMTDLGLKVTTALGGQGGFKRLCEQRFDLLITDFLMGDLDGLFLVKMANLLHPEMKIIVMTGSPHLIPGSLPLFYRFDALLEKPFRLGEFKDLITRIMEGPGRERRRADEMVKNSSAAKILTPA
jgi:two-component system, OmpR family, alkaline phosphatase synthesis response regulator PhoP